MSSQPRTQLIIGIMLILVGSLIIQKRFYDLKIENNTSEFEQVIEHHRYRVEKTMRVVRVLSEKVKAPKNKDWLTPVKKDQWMLSYSYGHTDYAYVMGYFEYFYTDPEHEGGICCTRIDPDYVKYYVYIPSEGETIVWTRDLVD